MEEFSLAHSNAILKLELNGHCTLGSIGKQTEVVREKLTICVNRRGCNAKSAKISQARNPSHSQAQARLAAFFSFPSSIFCINTSKGELVWSVSSIEIPRQTDRKFTVELPQSGRYYLVLEKLDKNYGASREIGVGVSFFLYLFPLHLLFHIVDCRGIARK